MLILSAFVAQVVSGTMLAQNVLAPDENAIRLSPKLGEIPGGSDLVYCPESRDTDLFSIERLEVYPTPPLLERYVAIHIYGTFLEDITPDPTWDWMVDVNNGTGHESGQYAFCDAMEMIEQPNPGRNITCPPVKGFALISIVAFLPWWVGGGDYVVHFDAKTREGKRIYCLDASFYLGCPENTDDECHELT